MLVSFDEYVLAIQQVYIVQLYQFYFEEAIHIFE